jgi:hypothetical protein
LTERPSWLHASLPLGGRFVLDPRRRTFISRRSSDDIFVEGSEPLFELGWGGTRNHAVEFIDTHWRVVHTGHHGDLLANGESVRRNRVLFSGDRIAPARGLTFTFVQRDDLEALADALADQPQVLVADERVLIDFVLERLSGTRVDAERACQHLRLRLANVRTL